MIKEKEVDETIGAKNLPKLTEKEYDEFKEYRRRLNEKRTEEQRIDDVLITFQFKLKEYLDNDQEKELISLGEFFNTLLSQTKIRKKNFADYIEISSRNINKYINDERKFNIDHLLKMENIFGVKVEILLEIQLKNELLKVKRSRSKNYSKYKINDLL